MDRYSVRADGIQIYSGLSIFQATHEATFETLFRDAKRVVLYDHWKHKCMYFKLGEETPKNKRIWE